MTPEEASEILKKLNAVIACQEGLHAEMTEHRTLAIEHWEKTDAFMLELKPIVELQRFVVYLHKFLKWGGLTFVAGIGLIYWFFKR